ncbi:P-loop containing nucleoside triphosphate hydrolase protein [Microdochium bolleyi]|uniref:p-loop containing nucleoside triphosphate hydrolase protein n=1 Tax=Microdochium bolleyi TaxID=196109 RepID=A0A136JE19_9PEZI|nr:P-loop containing nucleoside triphosphate hydrolase protein [Microdochium bolleyi]
MVAARSKTKEGRARRAYYGIDIHELVQASKERVAPQSTVMDTDAPMPSVEETSKPKKSLLWTEKYRARTFVDLVGDDYTNRNVLRWLKRWDPLVFPRASRPKPSARKPAQGQEEEEKPHRKILMLTGPPGLGKTTLAHVCARQAGYEVLEINASDDRSKDVVNNQVRTVLGTETVKNVQHTRHKSGDQPKIARPVCVVIDEVDGVVSGAGGSGEGGFIKALMDLITTGEKNASGQGTAQTTSKRKKKTDDFRQMRPLILICNDIYHPSLRPLRQSNLAEIVYTGKPTIDAVVTRLKGVFEKEGIPCDKDAARKVCEAAWGMTSGIDAKKGAESTAEGDLRGIMVVGEWVAGRLRAASLKGPLSLTRQWVEHNIVRELTHGGGGARGVGRGNTKDVVTRIFQTGAGFPKKNVAITAPASRHAEELPQEQLGFLEQHKKYGMERLREMVETGGDADRIITDVFLEYPNREFNDDSFLTKPNQAYDWMYFHDQCTSKVYGSQDWELMPYLTQPVLAFHHLFATPIKRPNAGYEKNMDDDDEPPLPFSGPRADFEAREAEKTNRSMLQAIQGQLHPTLMRSFRSAEDISTDFMPYLIRLVSPDVKPVSVGGSGSGTATVRKESERAMVRRAAETLADVGIELQQGKIEMDPATSRGSQWVYRMEPDLDMLATFQTSAAVMHGTHAPTRYAVRQVLDQELKRTKALRERSARQARFKAGNPHGADDILFNADGVAIIPRQDAKRPIVLPLLDKVKKDFFGRVIKTEEGSAEGNAGGAKGNESTGTQETKIWVTFHEGMNAAVRKPISLDDLMRDF